MTGNPDGIVSLAGLTKWSMPFDRAAGARVPTVPDDPGIIHAVRPIDRETRIREPLFLEDTWSYRAALCGAKVKVIMPTTFKPDEDGACPDCAATKPKPVRLDPNGNPSLYSFGDRWSPGAWRRKQKNTATRLQMTRL